MPKEHIKVVVVGQGYVGLPLAIRAAQVGYKVTGIDLDPRKISQLLKGKSFTTDVSSKSIMEVLNSKLYSPHQNYQAAENFDIAVITVPTPLKDDLPDLSFIKSSAHSLASFITLGAVIVLESTTYPGTTEELIVPILETGSGLKAGRDFYVGYSPERIDPGNTKWDFVNTPKIVSGINSESLQKVKEFYDELVEQTISVSGTKEAELTKLLENTFRHVNIALVNELTVYANSLGINIWEVIEAASSKPFGFMKFTPGPGVGGHCLPVDPSYLSWQVKEQLGETFRFIELANEINNSMPQYVVNRMKSMLAKLPPATQKQKILLIGLSYKKDSSDVRESPSLRVADILNNEGFEVLGIDNLISDYNWPSNVMKINLDEIHLHQISGTIILTPHSNLDLNKLPNVPTLDTRNLSKSSAAELL